ncbi:MAG: NUDIX domain-containing protein [Pseudomonadota bacterium]
MQKKWRLLKEQTGYDGFFKLSRYSLQHELFNGGWSPPLDREVLHRGHAAAVIPYDARLDRTLLIEQFRPGAINDPDTPWLLEVIAGMVESGESDEAVVRREATEEAGIEIGDVHFMTTYYPSPGGSTETISLYWAAADLSDVDGVFGLPEEGEDIRAFSVAFDDALEQVKRGQINNSLAIISMLWFEPIRQTIQQDSSFL